MTQEAVTLLQNKRIVLAVTGSIAAYKAADLASKLTQAGALVDVILTQAAEHFVTALTFQSVTGRPVYTNLWQNDSSGALPTHIAHVGLAESADLLMVAPATANTLAKLAHGLADDLLSVTALAARCPLIVAPAMDGSMYQHAATQANVSTLRQRGVTIIEPETGRFASGLVGQGRLPDTAALIGHIRVALGHGGILAGKKVIVTAGGTREAIDPVRFITNRSSGKQGYALAQAALDAGAAVTLVTASDLPAPVGAQVISVSSAEHMQQVVLDHLATADALMMAAAVADFRPQTRAAQKIKKQDDSDDAPVIVLSRTPDILMSVKEKRAALGHPKVVVGFAAESEHLLSHARAKLERKGLDLLIANDITAPDAGFEVDTNRVVILGADGSQTPLALATKTRIAEAIIERVAGLLP
ncbi:MAG: bifunctional phosphopantothenoylcysteine decarboxylase/phosphopantothenate--cysteine ligase CoaBC [Anaerolineaceae bacterium]|nr:bifunctional phosphopantothenoylcysteine decarboxylase/phosphopantothenate--cysteine ligase CoaBC [Anaerolineaceae bacterium]